jgi:hypothetical protein
MSFKTAPRLSPETEKLHEEALARSKEALKGPSEAEVHSVLEGSLRAKYKIEVFFGPHRTVTGPNVVQVKFFESGKKLHGGGDDLMFICRSNDHGDEGCGGFITSDCIKGGVAVCPSCGKAIRSDKLSDYLMANFTTRRLAIELLKFFNKLGGMADIYCKYDRTDIRYMAMEKELGVKKAHSLRGLHIYTLDRILRDTNAGADLEGRIYAFLSA